MIHPLFFTRHPHHFITAHLRLSPHCLNIGGTEARCGKVGAFPYTRVFISVTFSNIPNSEVASFINVSR